jgi:hypothetical protein
MRRVLLCQKHDGEVKLTNDALALLIGFISVDHMLKVWDPNTGVDTMPTEWKRRATKRAQTAINAMGTNIGNVALAYWAVQDWGARIDYDEAGQQMWAVIDEC